MVNDMVDHPPHYTSHPSGVECIEITEHYNFSVGNAIKYLWRAGLKQDAALDPVIKEIQDCSKAIWYIERHIKNLEKTFDEEVQRLESGPKSSGITIREGSYGNRV